MEEENAETEVRRAPSFFSHRSAAHFTCHLSQPDTQNINRVLHKYPPQRSQTLSSSDVSSIPAIPLFYLFSVIRPAGMSLDARHIRRSLPRSLSMIYAMLSHPRDVSRDLVVIGHSVIHARIKRQKSLDEWGSCFLSLPSDPPPYLHCTIHRHVSPNCNSRYLQDPRRDQ